MNPYDAFMNTARRDSFYWNDTQLEAPIAYCEICGGEIYRRFEAEEIDGQLYHSECLAAVDDY